MSLPYPLYTEPRDDYAEVEAILTIIHEDGPDTTHPVIVQLDSSDADDTLRTALCEDRYWALDLDALESAKATEIDSEIEYWDDVEHTWPGASPFAA